MFNWGLWGVLSVQVCAFHPAFSSLRTFDNIFVHSDIYYLFFKDSIRVQILGK